MAVHFQALAQASYDGQYAGHNDWNEVVLRLILDLGVIHEEALKTRVQDIRYET